MFLTAIRPVEEEVTLLIFALVLLSLLPEYCYERPGACMLGQHDTHWASSALNEAFPLLLLFSL